MNDKESFRKALDYFNRAIQSDPAYAPAYAWRSYVRQLQCDMIGGTKGLETMEEARRDAEKAIDGSRSCRRLPCAELA